MNFKVRDRVRSLRILGVDEAGRGAVIGPLVICGVLVDEKGEEALREIGVKDSKELSPKRREELAEEIEKIASDVVILFVPASKIDANRKRGINLNQIEAIKMAEIINMLEPEKVIVDAPSHSSDKFKDYLISKLRNKEVELVCENFADKNYPVVSAASILAKVERDRRIEELKRKVGFDFGVGYSHDDKTIKFLEKLAKMTRGKMTSYVRKTWDTTIQITSHIKQRRILDFLKKFVKKI